MIEPRRIATLALAACLAAGCAAFDPNNLLSRRVAPVVPSHDALEPGVLDSALGEAGRRAALDFVWDTVNERYYDPALNGVDWAAARERWSPRALAAANDEEFWDLLDHMAGELRDAHTRVESPQRAERKERHESVSLGFAFQPLAGRLVVTSVHPDSDAHWAGARAGMALDQVGGEPAKAAYARALAEARESSTALARHRSAARRILSGDPGTRVIATFLRGDGTPFTVSLERRRFVGAPRVTHRALPSGFGYVRLTSWSQSLQGGMIEAIEEHRKAPGLVIDLRGNPGGSALMVRNVAARLFEGKVEFGRALTRTGKPITLAFDWIEVIKLKQVLEGTGTYLGPVAVLVDAASGSGSELFAALLQSQGRATVLGQTSCGCLLAYMGYADVPGGGKLAYSEVGFAFPDGRRIEGVGVVPDVPVPLTVADLLAGRDRVLEAAQAALRAKGGDAASERRASAS